MCMTRSDIINSGNPGKSVFSLLHSPFIIFKFYKFIYIVDILSHPTPQSSNGSECRKTVGYKLRLRPRIQSMFWCCILSNYSNLTLAVPR